MQDLVYELNYESAKIAKRIAEEFTAKEPHKPRFVAGAIGPTNKTASMSPDVNDPGFPFGKGKRGESFFYQSDDEEDEDAGAVPVPLPTG